MELNREQIVKALECCIDCECDACGYSFGDCQLNLMREALALIRELTEENERLRKNVEELIVTLKMNDAPYPEGLQIVHDFCEKGKREVKANTLKDIQTKFAMRFGTYTPKDTIKVSDVFKLLGKFKEELLEEET